MPRASPAPRSSTSPSARWRTSPTTVRRRPKIPPSASTRSRAATAPPPTALMDRQPRDHRHQRHAHHRRRYAHCRRPTARSV
ncbi:MAG: hypothetical protein MZV63_14905 [Marinilabiliales bacterium]|nr:hypothetical protein [Marinilabiliales bacterium]